MRISIVSAARNDRYGGDFLRRLRLHLEFLTAFRGSLDLEVIIVEWNPPADDDRLHWFFEPARFVNTRIITVPPEIHALTKNSDTIPLHEYMAKNVGIRRATGDYIITTNCDILFSPQLLKKFEQPSLWQDYCFYRANRHDLTSPIPEGYQDPYEIAQLCPSLTGPVWYGRSGQLHTDASGDFLGMSRKQWFDLRGFPELPTHGNIDAYMVDLAGDRAGLTQVIFTEPIWHQYHDRSACAGRPHTDGSWKGEKNGDDWGHANHTFFEIPL